jgi:predicted MFS family arabinose efflux permease
VNAPAPTLESAHGPPRVAWRSRAWAIVGALSVTETVSWGILYYAFAAFLIPMQRELGFSAAQLTGAYSLALGVTAAAGIAVGRFLDRHSPRLLMTLASIAGSLLVVAWSRIDGLAAFYALWIGIGLVMSAVLYEPAFTIIAKHFTAPPERRRAMTALTLVAALASFIFLPLSQALIDAYGWRDALLVLAAVLAVVTVPLHALGLRPAPDQQAPAAHERSTPAAAALRSPTFWLLSLAFVLALLSTVAMTIFAIPFLLEQGHSAGFAAFAVGLIGVSQVPGRLLFGPIATHLSRPAATASVFVWIAAGIALVVSVHSTVAAVCGLVLLGMGNGMATLARATTIADLYGSGAYGAIASVAGAMTTGARAVGPFTAALYAAAVGYTALLWTLCGLAVIAALLAHRAERLQASQAESSSSAPGTT